MFGSAGTGYVKDLPVRLNKKFYPLPKPDGSIDAIVNCSIPYRTDLLTEEYDFSVERKALEDYHSHLQRNASNIATVSSGHKWSTVDSCSNKANQPSCCRPPTINGQIYSNGPPNGKHETNAISSSGSIAAPVISTFRPLTANGILQPTVVGAPAAVAQNNGVDRGSSTGPVLRLEDFENVGCSPFDMVELKSINDLEELQRLWTQQQSKEYVS